MFDRFRALMDNRIRHSASQLGIHDAYLLGFETSEKMTIGDCTAVWGLQSLMRSCGRGHATAGRAILGRVCRSPRPRVPARRRIPLLPTNLGSKAIAETPVGADDGRLRGIFLYFTAQAPDLTVDAAVEHVGVEPDREFEQLFPRHDLVRPFEKCFEQLQFAATQSDFFTIRCLQAASFSCEYPSIEAHGFVAHCITASHQVMGDDNMLHCTDPSHPTVIHEFGG